MSIESRLKECEMILKDLGLPESVCKRKVAKLTFLAFCNIKPESEWQNATKKSMTLSKDIMTFVNEYYDEEYATNTRESFRKDAIKPFLEQGIILLNPDNTNLKRSSANTHYAITDLILETVHEFNGSNWESALERYRQIQGLNGRPIQAIRISNFKTISNINIELGDFNIFIGANGVGKSNILEALAVASASSTNEFNFEALGNKGVRYTRPNLMLSSFFGKKEKSLIEIDLKINDIVNNQIEEKILKYSLEPLDKDNIYTSWKNLSQNINVNVESIYKELFENTIRPKIEEELENFEPHILKQLLERQKGEIYKDVYNKVLNNLLINIKEMKVNDDFLQDYAIFDINTGSLRGISVDSRKSPLGINGEGLDLLLSTFDKEKIELIRNYLSVFPWCEDFIFDKSDNLKRQGLKLGRSFSNLYFIDNKMRKDNSTISVEASNEGILHVLFYLTLFISEKTPALFGIENIETALNPGLCRYLIKCLTEINKTSKKQVLITTHNPAVIDGMNLLDDNQRLFVVSRNDEGETIIRRVKFKNNLSDKKGKLSEMWMNGLIGGLPNDF